MGNNNSTTKSKSSMADEIIIKSSIQEITKHFIKEYLIIWYNPNTPSPNALTQLQTFCEVKLFQDFKQAIHDIQTSDTFFHVITSGPHSQLFIQEIYNAPNLSTLCIFDSDKAFHKAWAISYPRILCIEDNIENILYLFNDYLKNWQRQSSSLRVGLPAFAPIFDDSDKSEMNYLYLRLKGLVNFQNRQQAKEDFLALSKAIFPDTNNMLEFHQIYHEYSMKDIFRWYTRECFLYKTTNNCLRIATSDSIQYCRLILKDLETAIKEQYRLKSKEFSGLLFRGTYLSAEEWGKLQQNVGKDIEMYGFLSTTKNKKVAEHFAMTDPSKKALITILVPGGPDQGEQGFAEVKEFSVFAAEEEILFNIRSRFTILEATQESIQGLEFRHLVLLYGAQAWRKQLTTCKPVYDIQIQTEKCTFCEINLQGKNKRFFVSIAESFCLCHECLDKYETNNGPLLSVSFTSKKLSSKKIKGQIMKYPKDLKFPFYGYECVKCKGKKSTSTRFYKCIECSSHSQQRWCKDCFEQEEAFECFTQNHSIIAEMTPFSFWCEELHQNELNYLKFQDKVTDIGEIFQQAEIFHESFEYEKAIEYYTKYLEKNKKKHDPIIAACQNNIALIYEKQGEYQKAIEFHNQCLQTHVLIYGKKHTSTATSYNNLAAIYDSIGEYQKALEYYLKAFQIIQSNYGDNHADTATCYSNIGSVYERLEQYNKALDYNFKALVIKNIVLGKNHASTSITYNNIALVYQRTGEFDKALEYHKKALEIKKSVYGEKHALTARTYHNIGSVYEDLGQSQEALDSYFKALEVRKTILGPKHFETADSYFVVAAVYEKNQEFEKAVEYYQKYLDLSSKKETAEFYNNLGSIYYRIQDYQKALEYFTNSLEIDKSVHGEKYHDVAEAYTSLGLTYYKQEKYEKALENHQKSLELFVGLYRENHSDVADCYKNMGLVFEKKEEYLKAIEHYTKCLEITKNIQTDEELPIVEQLSHKISSLKAK